MQESKSCALPLGDSPLKTLFLTLHASLNYKRKGWVVGLEPTISRTTIWRANQLHHTHHNEPGGIRTLDLRLRRPLLYPAELQTHFNIPFSKGSPYFYGKAGDGNRTHVSSLEGWCSTIELHPHIIFRCVYLTFVRRAIDGARTRGLDLGKVARYQLRHYRTSG